MSKQQGEKRQIYSNDLQQIPADAILPKFDVPDLSTEFDFESSLFKEAGKIVLNNFLDIPIPLTDLSVYLDYPELEDYLEIDFTYVKPPSSMIEQVTLRPTKKVFREKTQVIANNAKREEKKQSCQYSKSLHTFENKSDPEIKAMLEKAFNGKVPDGKVHLLKRDVNVSDCIRLECDERIQYPSKDSILFAKNLDTGKNIRIKVHDNGGGATTAGFYVKNINKGKWAYTYKDGDDYVMQVFDSTLNIKKMTKLDIKTDEYVKNSAVFENDVN